MAPTFRELTTMRVGGPAEQYIEAASTPELVDAVRAADARRQPLLVLGGGSNLVVGDGGFAGLTVRVRSAQIDIDGTSVRADAGVDWDQLTALTVGMGLAGMECLSGVPGTVGATPVQNVGAYGTVTSDLLEMVTVYDRTTGLVEQWGPERCGFVSHRQSAFKHTDRYVILDVTYRLRRSRQSRPLTNMNLYRAMGLPEEATADIGDVRRSVLQLRRSRGYIVDDTDPDTWGVGSFFINPVLPEVPHAAPDVPNWPDDNGRKISAAWLIERAGFPPGYGRDRGRGAVALSTKHALAVTNRGDATTAEVMEFAHHIRGGVARRFGVQLGPECHLVNCSIDDPVTSATSRRGASG